MRKVRGSGKCLYFKIVSFDGVLDFQNALKYDRMLNLIPTGQKNLTLANPNAMSTALDAISNGKQKLRQGTICVLGDVGVGKTSLVRSLLGEEFKKDIAKTQGVDMTLVETRNVDKQWHKLSESQLPNFQRIVNKSIAERLHASEKRNPARILLNFLYAVCCTNLLVTPSTFKNILDKFGITAGLWLTHTVWFLVLNFLLWFLVAFVGLFWMGLCMEVIEMILFFELRASGFLRWNILGFVFGCRSIRMFEGLAVFQYFASMAEVEKEVGLLLLSFLIVSLVVQPFQPPQIHFEDLHKKYILVGFVPTYVFLCSRGLFIGTLVGWGTQSRLSELHYDLYLKTACYTSVAVMIIFNLDKAFLQVLQPPHTPNYKERTSFKRWLFLAGIQLVMLISYPVFGVDIFYLIASIMMTEATIGVVFRYFIYGEEKKSFIPGLLSQFRSSEVTTLSTHHFILQRHSGSFFFDKIQKLLEDSDNLRSESESITSLRFRIQDFAGDEEYYSYHHLFILDQAFFIIVFRLTDCVDDLPKRLMYWLCSVCAHTSTKQPSVFLVGTHRDSITEVELSKVHSVLKSQLLLTFGDIIECNDNSLFFAVENMPLHSNFDVGVKSLRQSIENVTLTQNAGQVEDEVPLRWLEICQVIRDHQYLTFKESKPGNVTPALDMCIQKDDFKRFLSSKELIIEADGEFENMLHYFHRKGLILYVQRKTPARLTDKCDVVPPPPAVEMSDWLLLNPQILAKAEIEFVLSPDELNLQTKECRKDWQVLKETGYISKSLLCHTLGKFSPNVDTLLAFMEVCNLICRLARPQRLGNGRTMLTHFLPARLPRSADSCRKVLWHNGSHDMKFYFSFQGFLPEAVFHRILARAYTLSSACNLKTDPHVYRNEGLFWMSEKQCYLLELIEEKGIKVTFTTRKPADRKPADIMATLWSMVSDVCNSDFKFLKFHCGPACSECSQTVDLYRNILPSHIIDIYPQCCIKCIEPFLLFCGNVQLDKQLQIWFPFSKLEYGSS